MKVIGILGSTGSIGKQALDIVRLNKSYQIEYLSCFSQVDEIINQAKEFHPKKICIRKMGNNRSTKCIKFCFFRFIRYDYYLSS